jgi:hypothetical protein
VWLQAYALGLIPVLQFQESIILISKGMSALYEAQSFDLAHGISMAARAKAR